MPDLRECPFCGSGDVEQTEMNDVMCDGCGAVGPFWETAKQAVELWNRRAGEDGSDE